MIDWLLHHLMLVYLAGSGVVVVVVWLVGCLR